MPANTTPKVDGTSTKPVDVPPTSSDPAKAPTPAQRWLEFDPFADETSPSLKALKKSLRILNHMNTVAEEQRYRYMQGRTHPAHQTLAWSDRDIAAYLAELATAYAAAQSERVK